MSTENCYVLQFVQRFRILVGILFGLLRNWNLECWFFSDFFIYGKVIRFSFFLDLKALFCHYKRKQKVTFSERLSVSDVEKKRKSPGSLCDDEKEYSDQSEAVRAAGNDCVTSESLTLTSPLSPEVWYGARSTRRPLLTGATTSSTWGAKLRRRWRRSLPATPSKIRKQHPNWSTWGPRITRCWWQKLSFASCNRLHGSHPYATKTQLKAFSSGPVWQQLRTENWHLIISASCQPAQPAGQGGGPRHRSVLPAGLAGAEERHHADHSEASLPQGPLGLQG